MPKQSIQSVIIRRIFLLICCYQQFDTYLIYWKKHYLNDSKEFHRVNFIALFCQNKQEIFWIAIKKVFDEIHELKKYVWLGKFVLVFSL